ncbi:hypothetical protein [Botryobacter ruber]|uniref:hypothetical protein n=1 Tax=Botryobacter ruber TaxID=2171629 RepID=UPI000F64918F|nr:hypothetical protein [Botryobacter ruber]
MNVKLLQNLSTKWRTSGKMNVKHFRMLLVLSLVMSSFFMLAQTGAINLSFSPQVVSEPTVTTDKEDYAPRSNAVFTGAGFSANEDVVLKVKNLSRPCNTVSADSSYLPFTVKADADGGFVTNWTVCDCPGDSLRLKATGQV